MIREQREGERFGSNETHSLLSSKHYSGGSIIAALKLIVLMMKTILFVFERSFCIV